MSLMSVNNYPSIRPFRSLFDEFFTKSMAEFRGLENFFSHPSVNIKETGTAFELELAAPGLDKGDLKVNIENGYLTISAKQKADNQSNKDNYSFREFNYSSFTRSFQLPENVDEAAIRATHENGILKVELPKVEVKEAEAKVIEIN